MSASTPLICYVCWPTKQNHYGPCEHAMQVYEAGVEAGKAALAALARRGEEVALFADDGNADCTRCGESFGQHIIGPRGVACCPTPPPPPSDGAVGEQVLLYTGQPPYAPSPKDAQSMATPEPSDGAVESPLRRAVKLVDEVLAVARNPKANAFDWNDLHERIAGVLLAARGGR